MPFPIDQEEAINGLLPAEKWSDREPEQHDRCLSPGLRQL